MMAVTRCNVTHPAFRVRKSAISRFDGNIIDWKRTEPAGISCNSRPGTLAQAIIEPT